MSLVKQKHLNLYKRYTEALVADLGTNVQAVSENVTSECPNCDYDYIHKASSGVYNGVGPKPFTRGICPVCKGKGELTTTGSINIKCTVNWINPTKQDDFHSESGGITETNFFQIKSLISNYEKLKNADYIIVEGVRTRIKSIIKRGLKENVVCVAICERDD